MSVEVMVWVLEHSPVKGAARHVLLSLANHAHADGTSAFPSVATMAREARVDERTVERVIRDRLVPEGRIRQTGVRPSGTKEYAVVMGGGAVPPRQDAAPASDPLGGGLSSLRGGEMPPEPSREPSENNGGGGARARLAQSVSDEKLVEWAAQNLPGYDLNDIRRVLDDAIERAVAHGRQRLHPEDVAYFIEGRDLSTARWRVWESSKTAATT